MNELIKNIEQWSIDRNIQMGRPQKEADLDGGFGSTGV